MRLQETRMHRISHQGGFSPIVITGWKGIRQRRNFALYDRRSAGLAPVLPRHTDVSCHLDSSRSILICYVAPWRREKRACLPLVFHCHPLLNGFQPLLAVLYYIKTYPLHNLFNPSLVHNSWYSVLPECDMWFRWPWASEACDHQYRWSLIASCSVLPTPLLLGNCDFD